MNTLGTKLKPSKKKQPAASKIDDEYFQTKIMLMIFKVLGLAPWNIVRRSPEKQMLKNDVPRTMRRPQLTCSKLDCIYPIVLVVTSIGIWFLTFPKLGDNEEFNTLETTKIVETIQSIGGNMIAVLIRLVLCMKRNTVVRLFNRFANSDITIIRPVNRRETKFNGLFFVVLFSIDAFLWVGNIVTSEWCFGDIVSSLFNIIFPAICMNWFVIQYIVMVKLVNRRFQDLNRFLRDSSSYSDIQPISSSTVGDPSIKLHCSSIISTFRRTHTAVYKINRDVCEFYSLPMLFTNAYAGYSAIYCAYYLVTPIVSQHTHYRPCTVINLTSWLIVTMLPVVMLSKVINDTNSEITKTPDLIHDLLAQHSTSRKEGSELRQFSLELLQRKIEFTAYGFFSLDSTLLHSIFSIVIKYLVIIVQFQLARNRKSA